MFCSKLRLVKSSIILFTAVLGCHGSLAFGALDLDGISLGEVKIPSQFCPYEDTNENILSLKDQTIRTLKILQQKGSQCQELTQAAHQVEKRLGEYFAGRYEALGVSPDGISSNSIKITCQNYMQLFRWEYNNALLDVQSQRSIPVDNFFYDVTRGQDAGDDEGLAARPASHLQALNCNQYRTQKGAGEVLYGEEFIPCLEKSLVLRILDKKKECEMSLGKKSTTQMNYELKKDIKIQEELAQNLKEGMQVIFSNLMSEECNASDAMIKAAIKSTINMGANLAGSVLGPSVGGSLASFAVSLGTEVVGFAIDYLSKKAGAYAKMKEIERYEEFESQVCMFINVQMEDCNKYGQKNHTGQCIGDVSPEQESAIQKIYVLEDEKRPFSVNWDQLNVVFMEPHFRSDISANLDWTDEMLKKLNNPFEFSKSKDQTILKMIKEGVTFFNANNNTQDYLKLKKYDQLFERIAKIQGLIKNEMKGDIILLGANKKLNSLHTELQKALKEVSIEELGHLLKGYMHSLLLKPDELSQLEAFEIAKDLSSVFKKDRHGREGDLRKLSDLTSAMIENFQVGFRPLLKRRYKESFQDAFLKEKDVHARFFESSKTASTSTTPTTSTGSHALVDAAFKELNQIDGLKIKDDINVGELTLERRNTFELLRNTVKDCLATTGLFYMRRKPLHFYEFGKTRASAHLKIKPDPQTYLKACRPFLCNSDKPYYQGIPLPLLTEKDSYPSQFGKYQCLILRDYAKVYSNIESSYLKTGKICGKTIKEWTNDGKSFDPDKNDISGLSHLIQEGKWKQSRFFRGKEDPLDLIWKGHGKSFGPITPFDFSNVR